MEDLKETLIDLSDHEQSEYAILRFLTTYKSVAGNLNLTLQQTIPALNRTFNSNNRNREDEDKTRFHKALQSFEKYLNKGIIVDYGKHMEEYFVFINWSFAGIGFIGNLMVIMYFIQLHRGSLNRMGSYHFILTLLAFADTIACITITLFFHFDVKLKWWLGKFMCEYGYYNFQFLFTSLSLWLLVLLGYERYRSIVNPFGKRFTVKHYSMITLAVTILSGAGSLSYVFFLPREHFYVQGVPVCIKVYKDKMTTKMFHILYSCSSAFSLGPCILNFICYRRIRNHMAVQSAAVKDTTPSNIVQAKIHHRNRKAATTLLMLIFVYVGTVIPGRIAHYIDVYYTSFIVSGDKQQDQNVMRIFILVDLLTVTLYMLNNVVNFVVYAVMMTSFRRFLLQCITCHSTGFRRWRCHKTPDQISSIN